jgi:hypothetical protein
LQWMGWHSTVPISSVRYTGHWVANDSLRILLVAQPPPMIMCPEPLVLNCTNGSAIGTVQVSVLDTNGNPVQVIWTVDGTIYQTNDIPSGGVVTASNVTFTANFQEGQHTVSVSASNGQTEPAHCSTTVTVSDNTPPTVSAINPTIAVIWPPNHKMIPVGLNVYATDNCDLSPTAAITQVICNESQGHSAPDWTITGPLSVDLRAERLGNSNRIYTIYVEVTDSSGNKTTSATVVTVPKSESMLEPKSQQ